MTRNRRHSVEVLLVGAIGVSMGLAALRVAAQAADPATPGEAVAALQAAVTKSDLDAYKKLMSKNMAKRVQGDFLIGEDMRKGKSYLDRMKIGKPQIQGDKAIFSHTSEDAKLITTLSLEFLKEDGAWKLNWYRTETKDKK